MARLLVEIEEELKRELKARLARNGETLKTWLTRAARAYVGEGWRDSGREHARPSRTEARAVEPHPPAAPPVAARPSPPAPVAPPVPEPAAPAAAPPRPPRRNDDYLD